MTPKEIAEYDQNAKLVLDVIPSFWKQMYVSLIKEGFSETQSMEILKTYITASALNK